jgi:hypothetical protein
MSNNVSQLLETEKPRLLEKMVTNPDLCNVVLALLGRCLIEAQNRSKPMEGIALGELQSEQSPDGDLVMRSKVEFHSVALTNPAVWPLQSNFALYVRAKAQGMAMALQKNPKLGVFFESLVERIESYAAHKQIPFDTVVVKQSMISNPGDMLVLKIGRKLLDA